MSSRAWLSAQSF